MRRIERQAFKNEEYINIVQEILNNEEFDKRKEYHHHGKKSVYDHSIEVSFLSYKISKKLKLDYESTAIGGLLHDFYYNDWHLTPKEKKLFKKHGFVHAKEALENSNKYFSKYINKKTENIILRHMFPLNIIPPRYLESWIVSISDKLVSFDILNNEDLLICVGIKQRSNNNE